MKIRKGIIWEEKFNFEQASNKCISELGSPTIHRLPNLKNLTNLKISLDYFIKNKPALCKSRENSESTSVDDCRHFA